MTLNNELSEFEKGKLVFNPPLWEGAEVLNTKMELLYNISNEVIYLQTGSTWDFFGVWHNITIGDYSNEDIPYILADGSEHAVFYGSGFSTSGVYYLRLTGQDATIDPAEQTDAMCNVQSDTKMTCPLPKWGETRGPDTGVTLAIIQNKKGEITAMNMSFDSTPQYTVRPTIKGYSISKAGSAGGQNASVYGEGFSTEEGVCSCTFSTLSSTAMAIGNTELQCLTPAWGDAFSSGSTMIEITATSQIALPASVPSIRSFTFLEEWNTLTQYSGTAKGGDRIAVVGYGFKDTIDEKYYCRISSIDGYMITDAAEYIGPKLMTCDTKVWNFNATENANFSILTGSESAKLPVYNAAMNQSRAEDHLVYAVYEEVAEASASGGSAWLGLDMLVGVHGLNPTEFYYVNFLEDSTEDYVWTDKTLPTECGEELSDKSIRYCVPASVPRWVHNVHDGASVIVQVYHTADSGEERRLTGYVKFDYDGYNADLYTVTTNLSISGGGMDCKSFDSHNELRDGIAASVGYSQSPDKVGLKYLPCTSSSTQSRRLAETPVLVTVTVQVKDETDAEALESIIDSSEFGSGLATELSSKGLSVSGVEVTWKETTLKKANIDCDCGHELKESAEDNTFSCSVCSESFQTSIDGQVCTQCSSGMSCEEPQTCVPDPLPGYWRKNISSTDVYAVGYHACLWEDACLGLECEESYEQNSALCGSCSSGYYRLGAGCVVCNSNEENTKAGLAVLMLVMLVLIWFLLLFYVRGIFKRDSLEFMDQNIVRAKKTWRKLRDDGALRQVVRLGTASAQPKGLRASRRGSKALMGSRQTLIEMPDGQHRLVNSDPGMQIIVVKTDRGYQPVQIPLGMQMVTLPDGRQHLYNEGTRLPAGAVVSPRATERRKSRFFSGGGPTPEVAAKNIYTAAEAVHGMRLILPNTIGRGSNAGLAGTADAVQSAQMNSTEGSHDVIAGATQQLGEEVGDVIERGQDKVNVSDGFFSEGLERIEHSAEAGVHKVSEVIENMPEYAERVISSSADAAKEGAELTTEGVEVVGECVKEGFLAAGDALNEGTKFAVDGSKVLGELAKDGAAAAGEFAKEGYHAFGDISSKGAEIASKGTEFASDLISGGRLEVAGEYIEKGFQESKDAIGEGIQFASEGMGFDGEIIQKGVAVTADVAKEGVEFLSNGMESISSKFSANGLEAVKDGAKEGVEFLSNGMESISSKFSANGLEAVKDGASSGLAMAEQGISVAGEHLQNGLEAVKMGLAQGWLWPNREYQWQESTLKMDSRLLEILSRMAEVSPWMDSMK